MNNSVSEALCARCVRAALCTIPNETGEIILSCDSFMGFDAVDGLTACGVDAPELMDSGRAYGLCGDCKNRGHCMLRQCEGGVWHCEEYC
ncbi:MAG TPA: hypothetical protein PLL36_02255 [Candidatus Hydrogenedentes bacterium]|nr:hypothetical protein [Candidatus Hydrogenedentota bacterium]OQB43554.1 MAG: hypothetical protein BWY09_00138 [Candidatus Hydrogenedentes bacterium ADurb.Bin179]HOC68246.1 hypothetical protein [Candidatus Hydrogenedentota bacterium]HQM99864.1 hypothetical protein [Candidatus Hydrogenedentota bacterium]